MSAKAKEEDWKNGHCAESEEDDEGEEDEEIKEILETKVVKKYTVQIDTQSGIVRFYKCKPNTLMKKLFEQHARWAEVQVTSLRFMLDSEHVDGNKTYPEVAAEYYGDTWENEDPLIFNVFQEMIGG